MDFNVAVVYLKHDNGNLSVLSYHASVGNAQGWLYQRCDGNMDLMERKYQISEMPLFEVLNELQRENDELREKIEQLEETCVTR